MATSNWLCSIVTSTCLLAEGGCFQPNPSFSSGDTEPDGSQPATTTGAASATSQPGTTEPSTGDNLGCATGRSCIAAAPDGWQGPAWVRRGEPPAMLGCPDGFDEGFQMFADETVEPAVCGCSCGPAVDVICEPEVRFRIHDDQCVGVDGSVPLSGCVTLPFAKNLDQQWSLETEVQSGGCEPTTETFLPPIEFSVELNACVPTLSGQCDGTCATDIPDGGQYCVWSLGDIECPSNDFPEKSLVYSGVNDGRDCLDCQCAAPAEYCGGSAQLYSDAGCGGAPLGTLPTFACDPAVAGVVSVNFILAPDPGAQCEPSTGQPLGQVTFQDETTICCSPS